MDLTTNSNFLDDINPLDLNSSIPATRDLKDSIRALAMLHGCTMQEYLEQLISTEVNRYDIQKAAGYGTISDTQGIITYQAFGTHGTFDLAYWSVQSIAPNMDCRISFVARGKGKIYSYVYPGTALSEDGSTNDTGKSYSLKNQWEKYTYTFRTISNMYGDPTKTLIFRCQANDDVEFELDKGSVIIEKV